MNELKFKTNIKCSGCISRVTPHLDKAAGDSHWRVDIENPDKILTVSVSDIKKKAIIDAVKKAGFSVEEISG